MSTSRGGDKFSAEVTRLLEKLAKGNQVVQCGFFPEAEYPDGTKVAMVAAIQNYGAPARNIPPRPFFTNMVRQGEREWPKVLLSSIKARNYDIKLALTDLGHEMEGELRQSIQQTNSPPLRPATIKRKGHPKPLVDTGRMFDSVVSKVENR